MTPERKELMDKCVAEGMSLNEMRRSFGFDYRTVKRHHEGYSAFPVGGGGEAQAIRQMNQDLQKIDKNGRLAKRRHRG